MASLLKLRISFLFSKVITLAYWLHQYTTVSATGKFCTERVCENATISALPILFAQIGAVSTKECMVLDNHVRLSLGD